MDPHQRQTEIHKIYLRYKLVETITVLNLEKILHEELIFNCFQSRFRKFRKLIFSRNNYASNSFEDIIMYFSNYLGIRI